MWVFYFVELIAKSRGVTGMDDAGLRKKIVREARKLGADLIGFAPVSRWREHNELKPEYWPDTIWSKAETVIVLGIPMLLPIVESTPSINHTVLYDTTNVLLDQMAYRLAVYLNSLGHSSIFMPRDGYGSLEILLKKMPACFSQVYAGKYAGLGTIGFSQSAESKVWSPSAVRIGSVIGSPQGRSHDRERSLQWMRGLSKALSGTSSQPERGLTDCWRTERH